MVEARLPAFLVVHVSPIAVSHLVVQAACKFSLMNHSEAIFCHCKAFNSGLDFVHQAYKGYIQRMHELVQRNNEQM